MWYNNLAQEIQGVSVSKAQGIILKSLERLEAKDKESILAKMSGAETTELAEQNQVDLVIVLLRIMCNRINSQVLMMLLKVSCEVKQESHEVSLLKYFLSLVLIKIFSAHWSLAGQLGRAGDSRPGALHAGGRQVSQEVAG